MPPLEIGDWVRFPDIPRKGLINPWENRMPKESIRIRRDWQKPRNGSTIATKMLLAFETRPSPIVIEPDRVLWLVLRCFQTILHFTSADTRRRTCQLKSKALAQSDRIIHLSPRLGRVICGAFTPRHRCNLGWAQVEARVRNFVV